MSGYSVNIDDFDNDGWKDIFVSRGDVASPNMADRVHVDQPNTVFRNLNGTYAALTGKPAFCAASAQASRRRGCGLQRRWKARYRRHRAERSSGDLDQRQPGNNHWLDLSLRGTKSNRDGIGARIKLTARERCNSIT